MKALVVVLMLFSSQLFAQIAPPSDTVKKKNGQPTRLTWGYQQDENYVLQYFSIKMTYDRNVEPVEFKQVPAGNLSTTFPAVFIVDYPKYVYYVITSISQSPDGRVESGNSRTVMAERIGPAPY